MSDPIDNRIGPNFGKPISQRGRPDPNALLGVSEIASRLGVQANTVSVWRWRHADFPEPLVELSMGGVWWASDVDEWMKNRSSK